MKARWVLCLALAAAFTSRCSSPRSQEPPRLPATPEQAYGQLVAAVKAKDSARLYHLLDTPSQWSLMSIQRDQRAACELVQRHYPQERQARELQRCRAGAAAKDTKALFSALAQQHQLLAPLAALEENAKVQGEGSRRRVLSNNLELPFCQDERSKQQGWAYCGLAPRLEQLKVKAARDLSAIKDNVEIFKRR